MLKNQYIMVLDIEVEGESTDQPIFRPSADPRSKQKVKMVKMLEIVGGGVISAEREPQTMIPGLLASQRNMYNRLTDKEKTQVAYLLSDYISPYYYTDQMPKKSRHTYLVIDFTNSKEVYKNQIDKVERLMNNKRGVAIDKEAYKWYPRIIKEPFEAGWFIQQ